MAQNTYNSSINLNLARSPQIDKNKDPELYQELLDIHDAIERIIGATDVSSDFFLDISAGRVPGTTELRTTGDNPSIQTSGGFETIWDAGGDYVPPTTARLHNLVSTSTSDAGSVLSSGTVESATKNTLTDTSATFISDGVAVLDHVLNDSLVSIGVITAILSETTVQFLGTMRDPNSGRPVALNAPGDAYRLVTIASTGTSFVVVIGLDATFLDQTEFVVLNGTSNVATVKTYPRQFKLRTFGGGSSGAIGTITCTAQTDGTVSSQINIGNNQTLSSVYTIPINKECYLFQWWGSLANKVSAFSSIRLMAGSLSGLGYVTHPRALDSTGSSEFDYHPTSPIRIVGGVDLWVEADSSVNNLAVSSGYCLVLEDV